MQPLISIIIPTFNAEKFIETALISLSSQTYKNFEVIIFDSCSTDNTTKIVANYSTFLNLSLIEEKDKGIYDAMNKASTKAKGKYIFFLGSDDVFYNEKSIETVSKYITSDNFIYYFNTWFKKSNIKYDGYFSSFKLATRNISHQTIFYPTDIFKEYQYDISCKLLADYKLNIQLYSSSQFQYKYVNEIVSIYNDDGLSANNIDQVFELQKFSLVKKHIGFIQYCYVRIRRIAKHLLKLLSE